MKFLLLCHASFFYVFAHQANSLVQPNFVIFLADDLGIGDVGFFGNTTIHTPNIDSIANKGVKLGHHVTAAAVCTPSRAALLTGRYPIRSGMGSSQRNQVFFFIASSGGLPENETTIAKALKEKNYSTGIIGKWHLGANCVTQEDLCHHPLNHGFDSFYGLPLSNFKDLGNEPSSVITSYIPNFYSYVTTLIISGITLSYCFFPKRKMLAISIIIFTVFLPGLVSLFLLNLRIINGILLRDNIVIEQPIKLQGLTQRFVQETKEFLANQADTQSPFFLYLSFVHVHTALFTDTKFAHKSKHGRYGDNVQEMDWAVGEVLKTLHSLNLIENTLVYFSSDNGAHIEEIGSDGQREGGHNGIFKGGKTMAGMEGGIRVPSAIMWKGHIKANWELNVPTSQMDIFPTILDYAGIALPSDRIIDGKSLRALLTGAKPQSPHQVLFHYCGTEIHAATYMPENDVWKIHWTTPKFEEGTTRCGYVCHCFGNFVVHHNPPLLYNLQSDPSESHQLDIESNPKYLKIISNVNNLRKLHEDTVQKVPSQFSLSKTVWRPWLQYCCNFPYCSCTDTKYIT